MYRRVVCRKEPMTKSELKTQSKSSVVHELRELKVRRSADSISFGTTRMPAGSFTPLERSILDSLHTEVVDFIDNPEFYRAGARRRIFDEALPIAKPDTKWYAPLLDERRVRTSTATMARPAKSMVLTAAQERVLFAQLNYARSRVARLQTQSHQSGWTTARAREILRWHRVSDEVRKQLAETNLALVLAMAKRVRSADLDFGDLMSEGNMALMRSVDKFDFSRGFKFSTYACRAILKAYSRLGLKAQKYRKHFPVEFDPALERGDHVGAVRAARQTEDVAEVKTLFDSNRAGLSELERTVIFHRYGLDRPVHAAPMTLEKVGVMVGVTKERVRQIQNKALEKIRRALVCLNPAAAERLPTINGSRN